MSKILALDLGDQWVGIALSDASRMFARPYTTVVISELDQFLLKAVKEHDVDLIIVGYPKTMKGGESNQTRKIVTHAEQLAETFPNQKFVLWDERLSSQRAETLGRTRTKEEKLKSHALAAAFILDSYITYLQASQSVEPDKE